MEIRLMYQQQHKHVFGIKEMPVMKKYHGHHNPLYKTTVKKDYIKRKQAVPPCNLYSNTYHKPWAKSVPDLGRQPTFGLTQLDKKQVASKLGPGTYLPTKTYRQQRAEQTVRLFSKSSKSQRVSAFQNYQGAFVPGVGAYSLGQKPKKVKQAEGNQRYWIKKHRAMRKKYSLQIQFKRPHLNPQPQSYTLFEGKRPATKNRRFNQYTTSAKRFSERAEKKGEVGFYRTTWDWKGKPKKGKQKETAVWYDRISKGSVSARSLYY